MVTIHYIGGPLAGQTLKFRGTVAIEESWHRCRHLTRNSPLEFYALPWRRGAKSYVKAYCAACAKNLGYLW